MNVAIDDKILDNVAKYGIIEIVSLNPHRGLSHQRSESFKTLSSKLDIQELLNEVTNFLDILELLAKKNQSIFLLSETYWLKAHIATISLEITKAQELFNQAQLIADEFNIQGLASRISADHLIQACIPI